MKNVNITTVFNNYDPSEIGGPVQVGSVIEEIAGRQLCDDDRVIVDELTVITFANAFAETEDGILDKKYDILWVLESSNASAPEKIQLVQSFYDTTRSMRSKEANQTCRSFSNQIFKFTIRNMNLNSFGRYFLKIYLKESIEDTWQIQSINTINVIRQD